MAANQFQKGRGKVLHKRIYTIIAVPGDYDFGSDSLYYSTDNSDPTFSLAQGIVNGELVPFLTSDHDLTIHSRHERLLGPVQFVREGDNTLRSVDVDGMNMNLRLTIEHEYLDDMYVGIGNKLISSNYPILLYKRNSSDTSSRGRIRNIIRDDVYPMKPISFNAEIASGSISVGADYIDISSYTKTEPISLIPSQGIVCIYTDNSEVEYAKYDFFDPVTEIFTLSQRGLSHTSVKSFSGNIKIKVFNPTNPVNFDMITTGMQNNMRFYLFPEPGEAYHRSHITLKTMYGASRYYRATTIYSSDTGMKHQDYSFHHVCWILYSLLSYPDSMTTNMSSYNTNIVSKSSNVVSDKWFTNVFEADQGVFYDYCEENQYCGSCMGNTQDLSNVCLVRNDAYLRVQNGETPNNEAPDYVNDSKWNDRNRLENFIVPISIAAVIVAFSLALLITYGAIYKDFTNDIQNANIDERMGYWRKTKEDMGKNPWTKSKDDIKIATGITMAVSVLAIGVTAALILYPIFANKRFFPIVEYKRNVYNPPPGYTFVDAPTNDDAPA